MSASKTRIESKSINKSNKSYKRSNHSTAINKA